MKHLNILLILGMTTLNSPGIILDISPTGGRLEPGAFSIPGAAANNNNGAEISTVAIPGTDLGLGDITIAIDDTNPAGGDVGRIDWRDRGNGSSDPLVALGEDFIKNNSGMIRVALGNLPVGLYDATSYHTDPSFSQSELIQLRLTDAAGTAVLQSNTGDASFGAPPGAGGLTTADVANSAIAFQFLSNGTDDIVLFFDGTNASDTEVPLSGIEFNLVPAVGAVPEPTTLGYFASLLLSMGWLRRRTQDRAPSEK